VKQRPQGPRVRTLQASTPVGQFCKKIQQTAKRGKREKSAFKKKGKKKTLAKPGKSGGRNQDWFERIPANPLAKKSWEKAGGGGGGQK